MKTPKIKQVINDFAVFVLPTANIDSKWFNPIETVKEIEAEIDGENCVIEIHDILKVPFAQLRLIEFQLKFYLGIDTNNFKKMLVKKYGYKIKKAEISFVLYKFIEKI